MSTTDLEAVLAKNPDAVISDEPPSSCILRLRTVRWGNDRGLYETKQITWLKRLSSGYQCMREDCANNGHAEVMAKITNLGECNDGIYEAVTCNVTHDWESGCVDDYDYKLVPIEFYGPHLPEKIP